MTDIELEHSLVETIGKSDLPALSLDGGEFLIDHLLEDGTLKDIPIIGSLFKIAKTGLDIRNYLFIKKLMLFLAQIAEIPDNERRSFAQRIESDPKQKRRIGQSLLLLLDRADDFEKPNMIASVFKAYLLGEIDFSLLRRLWSAIDRINNQHIESLITFYEQEEATIEDYALQDLAFAGLVRINPSEATIGTGVGGYSKNDLGSQFLKYALKKA